jgi:hypothetical protein
MATCILDALVARVGVTLASVATAISFRLEGEAVTAEGDLDFRGHLGLAKGALDGAPEAVVTTLGIGAIVNAAKHSIAAVVAKQMTIDGYIAFRVREAYLPKCTFRGADHEARLGPAPMERRNHGLFDTSKGLHRTGDGGVGIMDGVVASLFLA